MENIKKLHERKLRQITMSMYIFTYFQSLPYNMCIYAIYSSAIMVSFKLNFWVTFIAYFAREKKVGTKL